MRFQFESSFSLQYYVTKVGCLYTMLQVALYTWINKCPVMRNPACSTQECGDCKEMILAIPGFVASEKNKLPQSRWDLSEQEMFLSN